MVEGLIGGLVRGSTRRLVGGFRIGTDIGSTGTDIVSTNADVDSTGRVVVGDAVVGYFH